MTQPYSPSPHNHSPQHNSPQSNSPQGDERTNAILMHLAGWFFSILGVFITWMIFKEKSRALDLQGKYLVNFHLSIIIISSVLGFLGTVMMAMAGVSVESGSNAGVMGILGLILIVALIIYCIIFTILGIIGVIKAFQGEIYKFPLTIPFLR